mgnify:CR=1 FL=1
MDSHNVWDSILARVETKINRHSFYTWFKPSSFLSETGDLVRVRVPNPVFRDWLTKHYAGLINEALAELDRPMVQIEFVAETTAAGPISASAEAAPVMAAQDADEAEDAESEPEPRAQRAWAGEASSPDWVPAGDGAPPANTAPGVGLNLRYTFDTFVVGPSRRRRRGRTTRSTSTAAWASAKRT